MVHLSERVVCLPVCRLGAFRDVAMWERTREPVEVETPALGRSEVKNPTPASEVMAVEGT